MEKILSNEDPVMTKEMFSVDDQNKTNGVSLDAHLVDISRTFRDFLLIERRRAQNTVESYGRDIDSFFCWLQENEDASPANWSKNTIIDYLKEMREKGKSDTTLRRRLASIRALAGLLVRDGHIREDFTADITQPAKWKRLPKTLSQEDMSRILLAPDDKTPQAVRDRAMFELLYATGMRVSEIIQLKLIQIELESGFCIVHGKGDKSRLVPIGDTAKEMIADYLDTARRAFCAPEVGLCISHERRGGP